MDAPFGLSPLSSNEDGTRRTITETVAALKDQGAIDASEMHPIKMMQKQRLATGMQGIDPIGLRCVFFLYTRQMKFCLTARR